VPTVSVAALAGLRRPLPASSPSPPYQQGRPCSFHRRFSLDQTRCAGRKGLRPPTTPMAARRPLGRTDIPSPSRTARHVRERMTFSARTAARACGDRGGHQPAAARRLVDRDAPRVHAHLALRRPRRRLIRPPTFPTAAAQRARRRRALAEAAHGAARTTRGAIAARSPTGARRARSSRWGTASRRAPTTCRGTGRSPGRAGAALPRRAAAGPGTRPGAPVWRRGDPHPARAGGLTAGSAIGAAAP
jgi:hypothetical protein